MKLPVLLLSIASLLTVSLRAEVSPIRMTIEQVSKSVEDPKDKTHHTKTQTRSLNIRLDNNSTQAFDGLVVKYWFLGRASGDSALKILSVGERKSSLVPRGKEMVESEVVSKKSVEEHYEAPKGGKPGTGKPTKVPASGDKISGYAVRLMKDGKVLTESYSEPSFKDLVDKLPAPVAEAKPAAKK